MRVQHNTKASNALRSYGTNSAKLSKSLEKLSSGYQINRAADDAAGLAVSEKMRAQITGLEAATKNAKDGIGLVQTAEGALTEIHDMLDRMYYLCMEAANGTYEKEDREDIQAEVQQLNTEIDRISKSTNFNGVNLLDGSLAPPPDGNAGGQPLQLQIGEGADETLEVSIGEFSANKPLRVRYLWTVAEDGDQAARCLPNIRNAINVASTYRANMGALQNRLEHTLQNLGVMRENIQSAESRIRDTDVAEEMMKFTKDSIMNQASQSMLAQANQDVQGALTLLQP